jgi:hypothetical protein
MTVLRAIADAHNVGLALPYKLRRDHTWIDGRAEKFKRECYGPRYNHFESAAAVPLQYPPL